MEEIAPSSFRRVPPLTRRESIEGFIGPTLVEVDGVNLRDYWQSIRKRLWLIAACCFGAVLFAAAVLWTKTPLYTAETTLLIDRQAPQVLDIREVISEPLASNENDFYRTQYEILKSRTLAAWSIREQKLEDNRLFTGEGKEEIIVARLWATAQAWIRGLFPTPPKIQREDFLGIKSELIDTYQGMMEITPIQRTRLVKVAFNTSDPELSALLANTHAQAYIRHGLALHARANEEAQHFLEEKLEELKGRIERSEAVLNRYRRDREIISLDDKENIVVERLADLNKRLTQAEGNRISLESQVHLIRKGNFESLPAVIENPLIRALKDQLARLEGEYAHLSTQFKPGYPRLDQLRAQVEEMRRRLHQEIQRVVGGVASAYEATRTEERVLRVKMQEQKAAALALKDASVEYAILHREVDTNRQLYDSVLQRLKETGVAAGLQASNVSIIDTAAVPRQASKPQKRKALLLSALLGLMGGVGLALALEYLDNTLKTPEEVERYARLPNLAVVPDFLSLNWRRYGPQRFPKKTSQLPSRLPDGQESGLVLAYQPLFVVTEAYRALRTAILLSRAEEPPQIILFTSAMHGEGKTATVVNTAIIFAQMGVRILIIDGDLRRPHCHTVLGVDNGPGLTEVLTGHRELLQAIHPTTVNHLSLLSAGSRPPNPTELVGSQKMRDTLAELRAHYDYILIDSPPVMPVSDAVLLSTMADGVTLVVNGQETTRQLLQEACARLTYARAKMLGSVLNRVDIRKEAYTYYGQSYDMRHDRAEAEAGRS